MGEAFDERGELLGKATGKSFEEVVKKLAAKRAEAAEIRVKKMDKNPDLDGRQMYESYGASRETARSILDRMIDSQERRLAGLRQLREAVADVKVDSPCEMLLWDMLSGYRPRDCGI